MGNERPEMSAGKAVTRARAQKTWIFLIQGSRAKLLEHEDGDTVSLLREFDNPDGRAKVSQIVTDRGGNSSAAPVGGGRHVAVGSEDPKEHAVGTFVKAIAKDIETAIVQRDCDQVIVAAEPHCLGKLKERLSSRALEQIRALVQRDLYALNGKDLYIELRNVLRPSVR